MIPKHAPHPNDQHPEFGGEEHAAREMVRAPESAAAVEDAARPEVKKPEAAHAEAPYNVQPAPAPELPIPTTTIANDAGSAVKKDAAVVSPDALKRAEEVLASTLGASLSPALTDGLILTLKEHPNHGKAGLELCLQGPALTANSALIGEEVLAALKQHPVFDQFFAHAQTTPHAVKPHEPEKADMMHVQIGHLTTEQYAAVIHTLAGPAPAVAATNATAAAQAAQQVAAQAMHASTPAETVTTAPPSNDAAMGLVQNQPELAQPSTTVQAPVAALDRSVVAETPQRAVG